MSTCRSQICNPKLGLDDWIDPKVTLSIRQEMQKMILDNETLKVISALLLDNIERGLKKDTHPKSIVKCFPTYVQDLPDGTEKGKFLALDLGGTNFRVLLVELDGTNCNIESKIFAVPLDIMTGPGERLFDHIAECLAQFAFEQGVMDIRLPLGFTWSFPLIQKGLTVGIAERWTKGFSCSGVIGNDVVQLLNEAIARRGDIKIDVCAILNDTTGTLMSCAYRNPDTRVGLILGTGTNGCYVEKQKNAEMFDEPDMGSGNVIINMEMGAFGDDGCLDFIRTDIDLAVDAQCINAGRQLHEKLISGMYLGEMVRYYILKFINRGLLFGGKGADLFSKQESFSTKEMTQVEMDSPGSYKIIREILTKIGLTDVSDEDCINVRFICECVSRRAAHLAAVVLVTVMHKMGEKRVVVGIDGSVYKYHPHVRRYMIQKIRELLDPSIKFDLMLSEDGSGIGAALVAAVAARKRREMQ
ncbi:hexokinase type 2-like [Cylas formicarius]|uniref:hexokinase type 2-like n=1 Tax=Cylas formicarius TaxID=197179 RepID=UPI0029589FC1|nr:hexokinase type 2-like [Cylas formicarius]